MMARKRKKADAQMTAMFVSADGDFGETKMASWQVWVQLCQFLEKSAKHFLSYTQVSQKIKFDPGHWAWPLRRITLWTIYPVINELGS